MSNSFIYWLIGGALIILAAVLVVWIRYNFKIKKITFKPPLVETEFERNDEGKENSSNGASINVSGNTMRGRNKIVVRRDNTNVSDNRMSGSNEIEVGKKPGPKSKEKDARHK